jgi:hypothetical protein
MLFSLLAFDLFDSFLLMRLLAGRLCVLVMRIWSVQSLCIRYSSTGKDVKAICHEISLHSSTSFHVLK